MKRLAITAMLAILLSGVSAQEVTKNDLCRTMENHARLVMEVRQRGVSMGEVIKLTEKVELEFVREWMVEIVIAAYDMPRYSTEEYRQQAAETFANQVALACYREMPDD